MHLGGLLPMGLTSSHGEVGFNGCQQFPIRRYFDDWLRCTNGFIGPHNRLQLLADAFAILVMP
jgi:hypothetical protein